MLKFLQFIKEANISASGSAGERHFRQYVEPWLPGNPKHGESHKLGTTFNLKGQKIPAGTSVSITGHAGVVNGVHHVHIETEHGETATIPVTRLQKPAVGRAGKNPEQVEDYQINSIHQGITKHLEETGKKETPLRLPDGTTVNVAGARKVTSSDFKHLGYKPKADVILYDKDNNPVHYASLKGHSYQQYGGITHLASHPIIKKAVELFKKHRESSGNTSAPLHFDLDPNKPEHREIMQKSLFGKDHGSAHGLTNVHAVYQGDINIAKSKSGELSLTASKTYSNRENSSKADTGPDMKILTRAASDRSDAGLKNARVMVAPSALRPNSKNVENNA
jgi:hypothetical protein